jgi:hypothetical protein
VGVDIPGWQSRALVEEIKGGNKDDKLSLDEFEKLYIKLKGDNAFKSSVKPMKGTKEYKSSANDSIKHTVRHSEQLAFTKWINQ